MKKIKKIISTAFILAMILGSGVVANAENTSLPPDKGSLTIHKYLLEDMSEAGSNGLGTELSPSELPSNAKQVKGVAFDVYKIDTTTAVPVGGNVKYSLNSSGKLVVNDSGTLTTFDISLISQIKTDGNGEANWPNLDRGYYFVVENLGDSTPEVAGEAISIGSSVSPFVVPVPMTNPSGEGWITDVHAYPKNQPLTATKEVDKTSITIGDELTYTIKPTVPSDIKVSKLYTVTDILDEALTFNSSSLKVYDVNSDGTVNTTSEISASNYSVTETAVTGGNKIVVTFNDAGRVALDGKSQIAVVFKTNVNAKVLEKATHTVNNKATVDFTNEFDQQSKVDTNEVKTHTGRIKVEKTATDTSVKLPDAKFQIADTEANAKAGNYLKKDAAGNILKFGDTGYDTATKWEVTTLSDGTAYFEGLADYTGSASAPSYCTYWIVETKAPSGYNLLNAPISVTFTNGSTEANVYTHSVGVVNTNKFVLPSTGGEGTLWFTIAGIVIIGVAGLVLISTKNKKKKV